MPRTNSVRSSPQRDRCLLLLLFTTDAMRSAFALLINLNR